jgi:hypothetical protein
MQYNTKFHPGERVKTSLGTIGVIQAVYIDQNSMSYFVKEECIERYWLEGDLTRIPAEDSTPA